MMTSEKLVTAQLVKKGAGHFLMGRAVSGVASVLVNIYLIRALAIEDYATYVSLTALQLFGLAALSLGLDRIVAVLAGRGRTTWLAADLRWLIVRSMLVRLIIVGLCLVLAELYLGFLDSHGLRLSVRLAFYAQCFCFAAFEVLLATCQALLLQRGIRDALFVQWVARLAMLVFLGNWIGLNLALAMWVFAVTTLISCLILVGGAVRFIRYAAQDPIERTAADRQAIMREMLATGFNNQTERWLQLPSSGGALRLVCAAVTGVAYVSLFGFLQSLVAAVQRYTPLTLGGQMITGVLAGVKGSGRDAGEKTCAIFAKLTFMLLAYGIAVSLAGGDDIVRWMTAGKLQEGAIMLAVLLAGLAWASAWQAIVVVENVGADRAVLSRCSLVGAAVSAVCIGVTFQVREVAIWLLPLTPLIAYALQLAAYARKRPWAGAMSVSLFKFVAISVVCGIAPSLLGRLIGDMHGSAVAGVALATLLFISSLKLIGVFSHAEIASLSTFDRRIGRWAGFLSYRD